jgi:hypothetical protein
MEKLARDRTRPEMLLAVHVQVLDQPVLTVRGDHEAGGSKGVGTRGSRDEPGRLTGAHASRSIACGGDQSSMGGAKSNLAAVGSHIEIGSNLDSDQGRVEGCTVHTRCFLKRGV